MPLQSATPAPSLLDDFLERAGLSRANKPLALVFLRSDCPWCVSEAPRMSDVFTRSGKLAVAFVGVMCGRDTPDSARAFGLEKELSFPLVADEGSTLTSAFAIERVPSIAIINAGGLVERTFQGVTEQLPGIVAQTLAAVASDSTPPQYDMIGNGCAP